MFCSVPLVLGWFQLGVNPSFLVLFPAGDVTAASGSASLNAKLNPKIQVWMGRGFGGASGC